MDLDWTGSFSTQSNSYSVQAPPEIAFQISEPRCVLLPAKVEVLARLDVRTPLEDGPPTSSRVHVAVGSDGAVEAGAQGVHSAGSARRQIAAVMRRQQGGQHTGAHAVQTLRHSVKLSSLLSSRDL